MKIYSVNDKEFAAYGKVHTGYDVSDLLSALDKSTPLPDAVGYVPSEAALENTKLFGAFAEQRIRRYACSARLVQRSQHKAQLP